MSRKFAIAVLAVMLVLLGVMNLAVQRAAKPGHGDEDEQAAPPSPEAQKKMEEARKASAENMRKLEETRRKQVLASARAHAQKPVTKPKVPAGSIDISENWFEKTKDGSAGVAQQKKVLEQEKKAPPVAPSAKPPVPMAPPGGAPNMPPQVPAVK